MSRKIKVVALLGTSLLVVALLVVSLVSRLQISFSSGLRVSLPPGLQISLSPKPQQLKANTAGNIVVDYSGTGWKLDPNAIGMDLSGYGTPYVFVNDPLEQQKLKALNIKYMRIDLKYSTPGDPTSRIVCGADGCDTRFTGEQWLQTIKASGAQPMIILPYSVVDAANIVKTFNKNTANYVQYWVIGNEPDRAGISASVYSDNFNKVYDAVKAIDPTIKVGGGVTAWNDIPFLQTFLQNSGGRVDFIDFHGYAQEGNANGDYTTLFQIAAGYGNSINNIRALIQQIVPERAEQIAIEVGEWELNWGGTAQDDTNFHALWTASVLGHILSSHGRSLFFDDKGNAFYESQRTITDSHGHVVQINLDDPNPAYHGIGMFTGEGLFRGFGDSMVAAHTALPNVEVYASDNPKNIVVINKDPSVTQTAMVNLRGVTSGRVDIWRKDESVLFSDPPVKLETRFLRNGTFTYQLTPFSITTFIVNTNSQSAPIQTPSPAIAPSTAPAMTLANDTFQRANQINWGTASDGQVWDGDASRSQDFSIVNHGGQIANGYNTYSAILGPAATNAQVLFSGSINSFQNTNIGAVLHWTDDNNWYKAYIDGSDLIIQKKLNGTATILSQTLFTALPGAAYSLRFSIAGSTLSAKVWPTGGSEPAYWMAVATDSTLQSGRCGLRILAQGAVARLTSFTATAQQA